MPRIQTAVYPIKHITDLRGDLEASFISLYLHQVSFFSASIKPVLSHTHLLLSFQILQYFFFHQTLSLAVRPHSSVPLSGPGWCSGLEISTSEFRTTACTLSAPVSTIKTTTCCGAKTRFDTCRVIHLFTA